MHALGGGEACMHGGGVPGGCMPGGGEGGMRSWEVREGGRHARPPPL